MKGSTPQCSGPQPINRWPPSATSAHLLYCGVIDMAAADTPSGASSPAAGGSGHDDEPAAAPVVDADEQSGETAGPGRPKGDRLTRTGRLAAAVAVVALVGAAYGGWSLYQRHEKDVAAAQALAAAEKYVVTLTNVDSDAIDANAADILDGSTGEFNDFYTKSREQHRQLLVDNKVTARGKVVESAVKSADTNKVQVLLMVDQSVSNLADPEPQIDRSRVKMTMEKVDGRWLVSRMELL